MGYNDIYITTVGEVAEWSNAPVLKTGDSQGSGGSNPSLSALPFRYFSIGVRIPRIYSASIPLFFYRGSNPSHLFRSLLFKISRGSNPSHLFRIHYSIRVRIPRVHSAIIISRDSNPSHLFRSLLFKISRGSNPSHLCRTSIPCVLTGAGFVHAVDE